MIWLFKHWKPTLAAIALLALFGAWQYDRARQYTRGQTDKAAEISLALAAAPQSAQHCPQPPLPPARLTARTLPKAGFYSDNARNDMRQWQKPPTSSATTLPNGGHTAKP